MAGFTKQQVHHIATLATIPIADSEEEKLAQDFSQTLEYIENLKKLDTSDVEPTHQVTGLENVWREDIVDESHMFTQAEALANAPHTDNGYFVVPQILAK